MSHTTFEPVTERLHRSELAAPGSNPKMIEKASRSAADVIFLDLEDSVAPDDKPQARKNVIAALNDLDWGRKTVSVRINGLDTRVELIATLSKSPKPVRVSICCSCRRPAWRRTCMRSMCS